MFVQNHQQTNHITNQPQFKGRTSGETIKKGIGYLVHETAFFREPQTDEFVTKELIENAKHKESINVVVAGCSSGEEVLTLNMLLDKIKDKVKILGFDLSPKSIKQAERNRFPIQKPIKPNGEYDSFYSDKGISLYEDYYLGFDTDKLTETQKKNRTLFHEYMEPTGEEYLYNGGSTFDRFTFWLKRNTFKRPKLVERKMFKVKEGKANNCKFVQGDVENIDQVMNGEKADAIFFKNAFYHLTTMHDHTGLHVRPNSEAIIREQCQRFKNNLTDDGFVIFGEQDGRNMLDDETLPKVMEELGFTPLNATEKHKANVWRLNKTDKK